MLRYGPLLLMRFDPRCVLWRVRTASGSKPCHSTSAARRDAQICQRTARPTVQAEIEILIEWLDEPIAARNAEIEALIQQRDQWQRTRDMLISGPSRTLVLLAKRLVLANAQSNF